MAFWGVWNHPEALQRFGIWDCFGVLVAIWEGLQHFGGLGPFWGICSHPRGWHTWGWESWITQQRQQLGNGFQHPHPKKSPALHQPSWGADPPHPPRRGGPGASISLCSAIPDSFCRSITIDSHLSRRRSEAGGRAEGFGLLTVNLGGNAGEKGRGELATPVLCMALVEFTVQPRGQ